MNAAENIKRRDDKVRAGIDSVTALRDGLKGLSPDQARGELDKVLAFFRHEVAPHARAEERVFYPEVSRVLGVELGERMVGEHRYMGGLVSELTELRHRIAVDGMFPAGLYRVLTSLVDVVTAHLRLEEEVLDRLVSNLTDSEQYFLFERIEQAEFDAIVQLSAPRAESHA